MVNIMLCDDNAREMGEISDIVSSYYSGECTLYCFEKATDSFDFISGGHVVDLAFLDIMMPVMSGIELAEKMRELGFEGEIVFLTNVNDYAAQSYQVNALSYLLKPVQKRTVADLLDKFEASRKEKDSKVISLIRRNYSRYIKFSELMYVEVMEHYLYFHLNNGEMVNFYATLREYSDAILADPRMTQCHRSYIVNMDYIDTYESREIVMRDGTKLGVSKSYKNLQQICFKWMFGKRVPS